MANSKNNSKKSTTANAVKRSTGAARQSDTACESLKLFSRIGDQRSHRLPVKLQGTGPDTPLKSKSAKK